jgi:mono/diheme cytochrome c family protein
MNKRVLKGFLLCATLALVVVVTQSFSGIDTQDDPWVIPDKFLNMDSPVSGQLGLGKDMFKLHCQSCHGKEGLGDGPKAAQLDTESGDFTDEDFQKQSDGVLFYKTWTGHGDMPAFDKKMSQQEAWAVVNYLRKFE